MSILISAQRSQTIHKIITTLVNPSRLQYSQIASYPSPNPLPTPPLEAILQQTTLIPSILPDHILAPMLEETTPMAFQSLLPLSTIQAMTQKWSKRNPHHTLTFGYRSNDNDESKESISGDHLKAAITWNIWARNDQYEATFCNCY